MQSTVEAFSLQPGDSIGEYVIQAVIGDGGFSIVYRAEDTQLDRPVAIKQLRPEAFADRSARAWFMREAQLTASLHHPNIVQIYSLREERDSLFLVMEYLPADLLQIMRAQGHLDQAALLHVASDICRALDTLHARTVIHRDIKPENILIAEVDQRHFKLADFGLAHVHPTQRYGRNDATGPQPGTLLYMSPEQALGQEITPRSDIYSLAVVLYEAATGQYYLDFDEERDDDRALLHLITHTAPLPFQPNGSGISIELEKPLLRALSKDPRERPANARAFLADLKSAAARGRRAPTSRKQRTLAAGVTAASPELLRDLYAVRTLRDADNQPEKAAEQLAAIRKSWPSIPAVMAEWGETLIALGQVEEGRQALETAARQQPDLPFAQLALAALYRDLDDNDEAAEASLVQAIEVDPDLAYAVLYPDIVESLDQPAVYDDFVEPFRRAAVEQPAAPILHTLGQVLALSPEHVGESIAAFEAALQRNPDYGPAYVGLASLLLEAGNVGQALDLLERSTFAQFPVLSPLDWHKSETVYQIQHAYLALAVTYAQIAEYEASVTAAREVLELDRAELEQDAPELLDTYVQAAQRWLQHGETQRAYQLLNQAVPLAAYWGHIHLFTLLEATERHIPPEHRCAWQWDSAREYLENHDGAHLHGGTP